MKRAYLLLILHLIKVVNTSCTSTWCYLKFVAYPPRTPLNVAPPLFFLFYYFFAYWLFISKRIKKRIR